MGPDVGTDGDLKCVQTSHRTHYWVFSDFPCVYRNFCDDAAYT